MGCGQVRECASKVDPDQMFAVKMIEQDGEEGIVESVSHRRSHNVYAIY